MLSGFGILGTGQLTAQAGTNLIVQGKVHYESVPLATKFVKLDGEWEYYPRPAWP